MGLDLVSTLKAASLSGILAAASAMGAAQAAEESTAGGNVGVGAGVAVGAVAGGPPGAIIGAAVGGLLGDRVGRARRVAPLTEALEDERERSAGLEVELTRARHAVRGLEQELVQSERTARAADGMRLEVLFRTGSAELGDEARQRLTEFGKAVSRMDGVTITLDGHADPRGSDALNQALAADRAASVHAALLESGLSPDRVTTRSHGASASTSPEGDLDAYAFDRRVSIMLSLPVDGRRMADNR